MSNQNSTDVKPVLNKYPVFEANQVLTNRHLNQVRDYLEQQDRLSRIYLTGMGIVSGLRVKSDIKSYVEISCGCGVTSYGYLVVLESEKLEKYREYDDPLNYSYFRKGKKQAPLWELLPEKYQPSKNETKPIRLISKTADFLADKVLLLYVECYDWDLKSCFGENCDDKGKERVLTVRKLLVKKTDLALWLNKPKETAGTDWSQQFCSECRLDELSIERFIVSPAIKDATDIYTQYRTICSNAIPKISNALIAAYARYQGILAPHYQVNPFVNYQRALNELLRRAENSGRLQYFYDFLKDIILAYSELRESLTSLMLDYCNNMSYCTDTEKFPKHLIIGELDADNCCDLPVARQHFIAAPIVLHEQKRIARIFSLVDRIKILPDSFSVPENNDKNLSQVKITPSKEKLTLLGNRSIPYYYSYPAVRNLWNEEFTLQCRADKILSYSVNDMDINGTDPVRSPLKFNIDEHAFLRIEGHLFKNYKEVEMILERIKKIYNLPFKVVALKLDTSVDNVPVDYDCCFEDLQEDYFFHRNKLVDIVSSLQDYYELLVKQNKELMVKDVYETKGDRTEIKINIDKGFAKIDSIIKEALPPCLQDFNYENFKKIYKEVVNYVLNFALIDKGLLIVLYSKVNNFQSGGNFSLGNTWINYLVKLVYSLLNSLYYTRLYRIYYSFRLREYKLAKELNFSAFADKNPGMTHLAGVYMGGTLILVHKNYNADAFHDDNRIVADFTLPYTCCEDDCCATLCLSDEELKKLKIPPFAKPDYVLTFKNTEVEIHSLINDGSIYGDKIELVKPLERTETDKGGKVVAGDDKTSFIYTPPKDFTGVDKFNYTIRNQYNRLEDEATVTIVVIEPATITTESGKTVFCSNSPKEKLVVTPTGGTINHPAVTQEGADYYFNPSLVDLQGKDSIKIQFTYKSDFNTAVLELTVNQTADADFDYELESAMWYLLRYKYEFIKLTNVKIAPSLSIKIGENVIFTNLSQNAPDTVEYQWNIDGSNVEVDDPMKFTKNLPYGEHMVRLTAYSKSGCTSVKEKKVYVPRLSLAKNSFCENDRLSYPFELIPAGGEVQGEGVQKNPDGSYIFFPSKVDMSAVDMAESKTVDFTYKIDKAMAVFSVEVYKAPSENIDIYIRQIIPAPESVRVVFNVRLNGAWEGIVKFGDDTPEQSISSDTVEIEHTYYPTYKDKYEIELTALNGECRFWTSRPVAIPFLITATGETTFCSNDDRVRLIANPPGGTIKDLAVKEEADGYYFYPELVPLSVPMTEYQITYLTPDKIAAILTLTIVKAPKVDFGFGEGPFYAGQEIAFYNLSDLEGHYNWSFGDGSGKDRVERKEILYHAYETAGTYAVTLFPLSETQSKCGLQPVTKTIDILPPQLVGTPVLVAMDTAVNFKPTITEAVENPDLVLSTSEVTTLKEAETVFNTLKTELINPVKLEEYTSGEKTEVMSTLENVITATADNITTLKEEAVTDPTPELDAKIAFNERLFTDSFTTFVALKANETTDISSDTEKLISDLQPAVDSLSPEIKEELNTSITEVKDTATISNNLLLNASLKNLIG